MTKRNRTPSANGPHDPNPRDWQQRHYAAAIAHPTWRNLGPKGRNLGGPIRTFFVIVLDDIPVCAGAVINGKTAPHGTRLDGVPLAPPFYSKRQSEKALDRIRRRHPDARRLRWIALGRQAYRPPTTCRLPQSGDPRWIDPSRCIASRDGAR